jgi:hypothetical protein
MRHTPIGLARALAEGIALIWHGIDWLWGELVDMVKFERELWQARRSNSKRG